MKMSSPERNQKTAMKTHLFPFALLLTLLALLLGAPARAATLTVTSAADTGAGTLRNTIAAAAAGDTITFAPALNGQTIVLTSGQLLLNKNLSILGPGPTNLAISGNASSRVFSINSGVTNLIAGLTITNGNGVGAISSGNGGGIYNQGALTVSNSTLSGNSAGGSGGGIYISGGPLTVQYCTLSGNSAADYGGGIANFSSTLTVQVQDCILSGNSTQREGGGIASIGTMTVQNSTLSGNSAADYGGGIYISGGTMTVQNSTLSGNSAQIGGGGIYNNGTLTARNSTLSGNWASAAGAAGGGIYQVNGTLTFQNCTLSGNLGNGGGVFCLNGSTIIANTTIAGNRGSSQSSPGGISLFGGGFLLTNTIVAGNFGYGGNAYDMGGTSQASPNSSYNLIGHAGSAAGIANGVNGNLVGNAGVGTLAISSILDTNLVFNGGPTRTHALVPGSPALNAGTNVAGLPDYDQRGPGFPRLVGSAVDIGAFEMQASVPMLVCPGNLTATNAPGLCGAVVNFTVTSASPFTCVPASGSFFPVGPTLVSCTASNVAGLSTCQFTVTVLDKEGPVLTCPPDQAFSTPPGQSSRVVNFSPTAMDNCGGNVNVVCVPPSGSAFAVGTNTVLCAAVDAAGNTNTCSFTITVTAVPGFVEAAGTILSGVSDGALAWGDLNGDGRPDLFLSGETINQFTRVSQLRTNAGGTNFTTLNLNLPSLHLNAAAWADYDLDGDLDLVVSGEANGPLTRLYRNLGNGTFTVVEAGLPDLLSSSVAWGDFDRDGRPDLLLSGTPDGSTYMTRLYRNCGDGHFVDVGANLPGVLLGAAAWADFDLDGNLDLALMGFDGAADLAKIYRGHGDGTFTEVSGLGFGFSEGAVAWGDYNQDGYPDVVFTGQSGLQARTVLYRNAPDGNGGRQFVAVANSRLPDLKQSAVAWGDFNNDGRLDVVIGGGTPLANPARLAGVYLNTGTDQFQALAADLPAVERAMVACADFNGDGKLDIVMAGSTGTNKVTRLLLNDNALANTPPTAPGNLAVSLTTNGVTLRWNAASDAQTPAAGLSYNVRISGPNGRPYVMSPAALNDGTRLLPGAGNAGQTNRWSLGNLALPTGDYTWSVQAIDSAFAGSAFSTSGTFHIEQPVFTQHATDGVGAYVLRFSGSNQTYHVEATTNLLDCGLSLWTRLGEVRTNAPGQFEFLDLDYLSHPRRFYRLVWP